jgi:hypothetical protein
MSVMPLQNRVTPFGEILRLEGRGLVMGNRGILHDDARRIVRYSQVRRWLTCRIAFRGRHRAIMRPHSYTELFFLDEATAFAAGHRPCRYVDYQRFRALWENVNGVATNADAIDAKLHADRLDRRTKRTYHTELATLPDGTSIALGGAAWLVWDRELLAWSDFGYTSRRPRPAQCDVEVLTPRSTVAVLSAGYRPGTHPSA